MLSMKWKHIHINTHTQTYIYTYVNARARTRVCECARACVCTRARTGVRVLNCYVQHNIKVKLQHSNLHILTKAYTISLCLFSGRIILFLSPRFYYKYSAK